MDTTTPTKEEQIAEAEQDLVFAKLQNHIPKMVAAQHKIRQLKSVYSYADIMRAQLAYKISLNDIRKRK
jgi:hypothetical protein